MNSARHERCAEMVAPFREAFEIPREFPTFKDIKDAIPEDCFKRSFPKSMSYAMMSVFLTVATGLLAARFLPAFSWSPLPLLLWSIYGLVNGTIATGIWVAAHECGHGAFCDNAVIQDSVGYVLHSLLLVPYFSWQRSHAVHHSRTNHMTEGETHVPEPVEGSGKAKLDLNAWIGEDAFAVFNLFNHLVIGWPAYLLVGATGGPVRGFTNHFVPTSDSLFPGHWKTKVLLSDIGVTATLLSLYLWSKVVGSSTVFAIYWLPYLTVNMWLVLYTWLQHTDVDVPHYGPDEWTWVKGAFATIDRPYPEPFDFLHHRIGSTHVAHHICSSIPHYNARRATMAIRKAFPDHYLYDNTPIVPAAWRIAKRCLAVVQDEDKRWFYVWNQVDEKKAQ
mmetsp:Transcript_2654/g.4775  ORF Transcript_2654/g.4775 Transcript_2654/m.4775 type:complete len:390 (+) Transcript_2654:283-1452(+)